MPNRVKNILLSETGPLHTFYIEVSMDISISIVKATFGWKCIFSDCYINNFCLFYHTMFTPIQFIVHFLTITTIVRLSPFSAILILDLATNIVNLALIYAVGLAQVCKKVQIETGNNTCWCLVSLLQIVGRGVSGWG